MPRIKELFEKNKTYYYPEEDWKIKYVGSHKGSMSVMAMHYVFKVLDNPEMDEIETTKPEEIYKTKREYLKLMKSGKV